MPLQDQHDFQQWIARRSRRDEDLHGGPPNTSRCAGCGQTADGQKITAGYCIECLAFQYGAEDALRRIAGVAQATTTTLLRCDPHASVQLVQSIVERMEDVLDDLDT